MASKEDLDAMAAAYTKATGLTPEMSPPADAAPVEDHVEPAVQVFDGDPVVDAPPAPIVPEWQPENLKATLTNHGWSERRIAKALEEAAANDEDRSDLLDTYSRASKQQARNRYKLQHRAELERELAELRAGQAKPEGKPPTKPSLREKLGQVADDLPAGVVEALEGYHQDELAELRKEVSDLKQHQGLTPQQAQTQKWLADERERLGKRFPEIAADDDAWRDVLDNGEHLLRAPHYRRLVATDPERAKALVLDRSAEDILGPGITSAPQPMPKKSSPGSRATESAHRAASHGGGAPPAELSDIDRQRLAYEHLQANKGDVAGARRVAGLKVSPPSLARRLT